MSHIHFVFISIVASYCNEINSNCVIYESHIRCNVDMLQAGRSAQFSEANLIQTVTRNSEHFATVSLGYKTYWLS